MRCALFTQNGRYRATRSTVLQDVVVVPSHATFCPMRIAGRVALVTGATGGLGQALARDLAARGARLLVTGRNVERLEQLAREVGGTALPGDLANSREVGALAAASREADIVVSNAALPATGPLADFTEDEIDRAIDVNLRAGVILARSVSIAMAERGGGHFVFVSSMGGKLASSGLALYSATKFGLRGFGLALRQDLAPFGIGVSMIYPGIVRDAGMWADAGLAAPRGTRTRSAQDVTRAVARAIERNVAEIDVAPLEMRVAALLSRAAPDLFAKISNLLGSREQATAMTEAYRSKR
jgi:short-subunit dehydrogenase